jgi:hypothetical protein
VSNPQLSKEQIQTLFYPLFKRTIKDLSKQSGGNKGLHFALRRKLTKELGYLERSKPATRIKLKQIKFVEQNGKCPICKKCLPKKYAELDRSEAINGYTAENTRLVHHDCHITEQKKKGYA